MRITCPYCGERSSDEFQVLGGVPGPRPAPDASPDDWHDYVYLRDNPAGPSREYWQHVNGCRSWLLVTRDTRTHAVLSVEQAREATP